MTTQLTAPQTAALTAIATGKVTIAIDLGEVGTYAVREIATAMVEAGASETVKSALASVRSLSRKGLGNLTGNSTYLKLTDEGAAEVVKLMPKVQSPAEKRKATVAAKKAAKQALMAEQADQILAQQAAALLTAAPTKAKRTAALNMAAPKKAPAKKAPAKAEPSELSIKIAAAARMLAEGTTPAFEDFAKGDTVQTADGKRWIVTQPALDKKTLWCRPIDGGKPIRRGWKSMTKVAS